ncbi:uncharacterized protein LOC131234919 [Magnolia sinica]|uniref:uncharacterized protein LOC131234919 n=1 Tax=Magnolia sinica TaxID=86752 RepID=UPI0026583417|nr:uncharacterized protein LOC131234919 [Magnolia sinica]
MPKQMLVCCTLFISESRNPAALESIERAAKLFPEVPIINNFPDDSYNRVRYTLVSHFTTDPSNPSPLRNAVFSMVEAALDAIDLELHSGTHPRIGVVDHICFHPLSQASLDQAAHLANSVAADIGLKLGVPVFLYGAADERGRTLDSIRRELGYYKPNAIGNQWSGGVEPESLQLEPDIGPSQAARSKGVAIVGATQWVATYNVPISSTDIAGVRRIARQVSSRGGGLASVEAIALAHGEDTIEVACNLLDPSRVGADQVQLEVERLAREEGMKVGNGYFTDLSPEEIIENYLKLGFLD